MYITVCGSSQKKDKEGNAYGWFITEYDIVERWVEKEIFNKRKQLTAEEAGIRFSTHIKQKVGDITDKDIRRFIGVKV